jgi:glucosamine--fructose-6-phosphate aminotransferase (isomerizing)
MWEDMHMSNLGAIMASEIAETPKVFASILDNQQAFDSVKNVLISEDIQSVLILARGTSDNAAHFLKYLVETKLGLPCGLTSPSSVTIYDAELHYQGVLVVALSQSGQSPDLVAFANSAKRAGAKLISLTNDANSPLAKAADHHLDLQAGAELAVAATKSYSAQLLTSFLLVATWAKLPVNGESLIAEAEKLASNITLVSAAVDACSRENETVVLGRGFAYPNAREAALKIQETCKVSVQGLSTADYLHGPISALTPDTQVFILSPAHLPLNSISEATTRIRAITGRIFWVGNGGAPEAGDIVIAGSNCSDEIESTIVDAISLQRFSLEFAKKSGFDPDAPVGLSKVTLTH